MDDERAGTCHGARVADTPRADQTSSRAGAAIVVLAGIAPKTVGKFYTWRANAGTAFAQVATISVGCRKDAKLARFLLKKFRLQAHGRSLCSRPNKE
jgi:hypothetical protein